MGAVCAKCRPKARVSNAIELQEVSTSTSADDASLTGDGLFDRRRSRTRLVAEDDSDEEGEEAEMKGEENVSQKRSCMQMLCGCCGGSSASEGRKFKVLSNWGSKLNVHDPNVSELKSRAWIDESFQVNIDQWELIVRSGFTNEDIIHHSDIILDVLNPPAKLALSFKPEAEETMDMTEVGSNPAKLFSDLNCVDEPFEGIQLYIGVRKADNISVFIKRITNRTKYKDLVQFEVDVLLSTASNDLFSHLLEALVWEDEVWLVMEYCNGASLNEFITRDFMEEKEIGYVAKEILKALDDLHTREMTKRELVCDNILIDKDGLIMVADLDVIPPKQVHRAWLAPEFLAKGDLTMPVTTQLDVFAFGQILLEMANGVPPFADMAALKEQFHLLAGQMERLHDANKWSQKFQEFVELTIDPEPSRRATVQELLDHEFLHEIYNKEDFAPIVNSRISLFR